MARAEQRAPGGRVFRALGLLLLGVLSACATPSRPLPMTPHLPEVAPPHPDAVRRPDLAIGVAPFLDLRSALSRTRQHPPVGLEWLAVTREGENSTGDASFLSDIAEAARQDAVRTLRYAQLFREVRLVPQTEVSEDLDLVLTGEVEELVGFQYQRWSFGMLGLHSTFEPPIGTARIRFRLLGPAGELWSERIEARVRNAVVSIEQVALDALAVTNERLAVALHRQSAPSENRRARSVPLRVLDACGLGAKRARRVIDDVSEIFEREAGVRFRPLVETWVAPSGVGPEEVLDSVASIAPPPDGAVLVLAPADRSPRPAFDRPRTGMARQFGRHALAICAPVDPQVVTVAHELGHLFGAVHSPDRGSIMYPVAGFEARFFDAANRSILRVARNRDFSGPPSSRLTTELRAIYRGVVEEAQIEPDAVREALRALP